MIAHRVPGRIGLTLLIVCVMAAAVLTAPVAHAAAPVDTVNIDLAPLIDRAASARDRFAVEVPHQVSAARDGSWTRNGTRDTWELTVRVPTAVTLSFHASRIFLPTSAVLSVSASGVTYVYTPAQIHGTELWSRLGKGDTLDLQLSVNHADRQQAVLEIAAFQAGYRSLGAGTVDHPHYARLRAKAQSSTDACVENYECHVGTGIDNSGQATAALVISNQFECSGTLLNNVTNDGTPYMLTARHCQSGNLGGGNPGAAASVVVYWDATTPCGQALQSILSASATIEYGQATVFEQQDAWLIQLSGTPPADAYMSGWDASGAAIVGGFSVDHAQANTKQYAAWSGTAATETIPAATLGTSFDGTFLDVVNAVGSIDQGASGSGLFNASGQLAGSLSLGKMVCPVTPPPAPDPTTAVAKFNALASVWTSTADMTSSTGSKTLASVLDPHNTGVTTLVGSPLPVHVVFVASNRTAPTGSLVGLSWSSTGQACTATGGVSGDGWSGSLPANGSVSINETAAGDVTYGITCTGTGPAGQGSATVSWSAGPSSVYITGSSSNYVGDTITLRWSGSNISACVASGGATGDGWGGAVASQGSQSVIETAPGLYTYTITCTHDGQSYSSSAPVSQIATFAQLGPLQSPTTMLVGQSIPLSWDGTPPCTASGGAPGDGWVSAVGSNGFGNYAIITSTPGTYTYTVTCGPGSLPATASVTLTFVSGPASAALTANPATSAAVIGAATIPPNLSWLANVAPCSVTFTGPESGTVISGAPANGAAADVRSLAGTYTYTVSCGTGANQAQGTAQIQWTQPTPAVDLLAQSFPGVAGVGVPLEVISNVRPCVASGGDSGDGWSGTLDFPANNLYPVTESAPGTYTYTVTCGVGPYGTAQASVVFDTAGGTVLTLTGTGPAGTTAYSTQPVTLSWNSQVGPCTEYGGGASDGWGGAQTNSGSTTVNHAGAQSESYTMICGTGAQQVAAQITLNWQVPPQPNVTFTWDQSHDPITGTSLTLNWTGVAGASCTASGGNAGDGWAGPRPPSGSFVVSEPQPGYANYEMLCRIGIVSGFGGASILWRPMAPTVTLSAVPDHTYPGLPIQLTWNADNVSGSCNSLEIDPGGVQGPWSGPVAASGSQTIAQNASVIGTFQFYVSCTNIVDSVTSAAASASASVTFSAAPAGTVSVTSSVPSPTVGSSFQLNWSSTNEQSCTATESPSGADGWAGQKATSGSQSITESAPGTYYFGLSCSEGVATVSTQATVTVVSTSSPGSTSSSGGGGAIDVRALLALAMALGLRVGWRRGGRAASILQ